MSSDRTRAAASAFHARHVSGFSGACVAVIQACNAPSSSSRRDPLRILQVQIAVRCCSLCLLKSAKLVEDFGRGRPNVRNFYNTSHSAEHVISDDQLEKQIVRLQERDTPLRLVFFGRFVKYKGLDRTIRAVASARRKSGRPFELSERAPPGILSIGFIPVCCVDGPDDVAHVEAEFEQTEDPLGP